MHGQDALFRQDEVHDREDGFLDFTSVACPANDDFFLGVVDDDEALGVEAICFSIGFKMRCVKNGELGLVLLKLGSIWTNEHVASEGVVPSIVIDDTNGQGFGEISAAVEVLNEQSVLLGEEINHLCAHALERTFVG